MNMKQGVPVELQSTFYESLFIEVPEINPCLNIHVYNAMELVY